MAEHPLICSRVLVQSHSQGPAESCVQAAPKAACCQAFAVAGIHAWTLLKALCGHSRPFFGDGPAALPVEPYAPICPVLTGAEVPHA